MAEMQKKGASHFAAMFNLEAAQQQAEDIQRKLDERGGRTAFFSPLKGTSVLRILPPGNESLLRRGLLGKLQYKHFLYWGGESKGIHLCGRNTDPERYESCPICVAYDKIEGVVPEDQLKRQRAKPRALFNAILRVCMDPGNAPQEQELFGKIVLLEGPSDLYNYVQTSIMNPQFGLWVDPYNGADLIVTRTGEGLDTRYSCSVKPGNWGPAASSVEETDKLLSDLIDLEKWTLLDDARLAKQVVAAELMVQWGRQFGPLSSDLGKGVTEGSLASLTQRVAQTPERRAASAASSPPPPPPPPPKSAPAKVVAPPNLAPSQPTPSAAVVQSPSQSGAPAIDPTTGNPVCYKQFGQRNPGCDAGNATDPQCAICAFALPCFFENA